MKRVVRNHMNGAAAKRSSIDPSMSKQIISLRRTIKHDIAFENICIVGGLSIIGLSIVYAYLVYNASSSNMIGLFDFLVLAVLAIGGVVVLRGAKAYHSDAISGQKAILDLSAQQQSMKKATHQSV